MVKQQAPKKDRFPLTVAVGAASVKIFKVRTGPAGAYEAFAVEDYGSGSRRVRKFSDLQFAKAEALRIATALANQDAKVASLDYRDASALVRLHDRIDPLGVSLEAGADVLATAAELVGVHHIVEACRAYARQHPASREKIALSKAADDYHAAKEGQGRSKRTLQDIKSRLGRFVFENPGANLGDFTAPKIQGWLDGLRGADDVPLSALTRKNFSVVVSGFFEHARRRGWVAVNPCDDVERERIRNKGDVEFYSPAEIAKLLAGAPSAYLPSLAIGAFAGLRSAEIERLDWRDVHLAEGHIVVGAAKAKTASRRLAPIPDNLAAWLAPCQGRTGAVWPGTHKEFYQAQQATASAAGMKWKPNALRHSFASYRAALTGDVARTSLELGNSVQVVHRHYRGLTTRETAEEFFNIRPKLADEVIVCFRYE